MSIEIVDVDNIMTSAVVYMGTMCIKKSGSHSLVR